MSDSVRPHRRQPTRLRHPWDSPSKNTGVGCHFLLQCMKVKSESEVAQSCLTLRDPHGLKPTRLLCPWDFPGKSTGVGCHCLFHPSNYCIDSCKSWNSITLPFLDAGSQEAAYFTCFNSFCWYDMAKVGVTRGRGILTTLTLTI